MATLNNYEELYNELGEDDDDPRKDKIIRSLLNIEDEIESYFITLKYGNYETCGWFAQNTTGKEILEELAPKIIENFTVPKTSLVYLNSLQIVKYSSSQHDGELLLNQTLKDQIGDLEDKMITLEIENRKL